jgi:very-short-patch-repair endonuclease
MNSSQSTLFILGLILASVFLFGIFRRNQKNVNTPKDNRRQYQYRAKEYFMTQSESNFFKILDKISNDRYFVFTQVHLSAILDHKIPGQNWKAAFRHINGKSIDYVLCDKDTLKPVYAVELDDYTHAYAHRIERDREVERMLATAGVTLVRFQNYQKLTEDDIHDAFITAKNSTLN